MARFVFRLFAFSSLIISLNVLSSGAVAQPVTVQDGPYTIMTLSAGDKTFANIMEKKTAYTDFLSFEGTCSNTVNVMAVTGDQNRLQAFYKSGRFSDLGIETLVMKFRPVLEKACPGVNHITLTPPGLEPTVAAELKQANNWALTTIDTESMVSQLETQVEDAKRIQNGIRLNFAHLGSAAGVQSIAPCEAEAEIELTLLSGSTRRKPTIRHYARFSREVAEYYTRQCPANETVRFTVRPLPELVLCPSKACYINTVKTDKSPRAANDPAGLKEYSKWTTTLSGYEYEDRPELQEEPIKNFDDMLTLVKANDFSLILSNYKGYYKIFHNQFLYAYSNECAATIPDSVTIEFQTVERTTDGYGNEISSVESGPAEYITLEKSLEPRFMAYKSANRMRVLKQVITSTAASRRSGKGNQGMNVTFGELVEGRQRLNRFMTQGCQATEVQSVYNNLKNIGPVY